jgi:hypothetical protein
MMEYIILKYKFNIAKNKKDESAKIYVKITYLG